MRGLPLLLILVVALALSPAAAEAVSFRDIIELTQAGLSDEVIIALIQADDTIYGVDAAKVMELRNAGVSEAVLMALLRNGRNVERPATDAPAAADAGGVAPQVIVIDHHEPDPVAPPPPVFVVERVFVPVVPFVPIPAFRPGKPQPVLPGAGFGRFINDGYRPEGATFGRFLNP